MSMVLEKVYHIYAGSKCIAHSVSEEDFENVWGDVQGMVGLMKTEYNREDLSYEEVTVQKTEEASY